MNSFSDISSFELYRFKIQKPAFVLGLEQNPNYLEEMLSFYVRDLHLSDYHLSAASIMLTCLCVFVDIRMLLKFPPSMYTFLLSIRWTAHQFCYHSKISQEDFLRKNRAPCVSIGHKNIYQVLRTTHFRSYLGNVSLIVFEKDFLDILDFCAHSAGNREIRVESCHLFYNSCWKTGNE